MCTPLEYNQMFIVKELDDITDVENDEPLEDKESIKDSLGISCISY